MIESPEANEKPPSPFLTIWFQPRQTIRRIIEMNSKLFVIPITLVGGIVMGIINRYNLADTYCQNNILLRGKSPFDTSDTLLWGIVEGLALAIFTLYLAGGILSWLGKRLGGKAEPVEIRAAFAWSSIPEILSTVFFIPYLLIIGKDVLACKQAMFDFSTNPILDWYLVIAFFVYMSGGIWTFVLRIISLSEVHTTSKFKAFIILLIFNVISLVISFFQNYGRAD